MSQNRSGDQADSQPESQPGSRPVDTALRIAGVVVILLLPTMSLAVLGGLYLWEKGWLLWWALASLVVAGSTTLLLRWTFAPPATPTGTKPDAARAGPSATPGEVRAWSDVRAIARSADPELLTSLDALSDLGQRTIEAVAARMHPERHDAIWQFTVPEALTIVSRVSSRLSLVAENHIPFGDRLTAAQFLSVYRWRRAVDVAEWAYDIWRVLRLVNPATAVTNEARERLSRAVYTWGREHVMRSLTEAYVEEVGRAAIDLYSGRLRTPGARAAEKAAGIANGQTGIAEAALRERALKAVVIGATAKRNRVLSAVQQAISAGEPNASGAVEIFESTAIDGESFGRRQLLRDVVGADLLVWSVDAAAGPSKPDIDAVMMIREHFRRTPRAMPPILAVAAAGPAVADLEGAAGELARGIIDAGSDTSHVPLAAAAVFAVADGPGTTDAAALGAVFSGLLPAARAAATIRDRDAQLASSRGGVVAAGRQAASAVTSLARSVLRRRDG